MNSSSPLSAVAPDFRAPPVSLLLTEPLRALFDYCAFKLAARPQPVGDGHAVIVFPGLGGAPFTTAPLRDYLRACGYDAQCWGQGVNTGPEGELDAWLGTLDERVLAAAQASGGPVSLVGWSLGGIYARELAKRLPQQVRNVITLGTPFAALSGATHAESLYRWLGGDTSQITPELAARLAETPPVPCTSIYSRTDGVVDWRGCVAPPGRRCQSVEVAASHLGMVAHPQVMRIVAERLAAPVRRASPARRPRATLRAAAA